MNYNVTKGTWAAIVANVLAAIVAAGQAVNWTQYTGPHGAGWIIAAIAVLNGLAHYFTGPNAVTTGTVLAIAANAVVAVLGIIQGADWVNLVGEQSAGVAAMVITVLNVVLHYFTGPALPPASTTARRRTS